MIINSELQENDVIFWTGRTGSAVLLFAFNFLVIMFTLLMIIYQKSHSVIFFESANSRFYNIVTILIQVLAQNYCYIWFFFTIPSLLYSPENVQYFYLFIFSFTSFATSFFALIYFL